MANEALRVGAIVEFAPVAVGFEFGGKFGIAQSTDFFWDAVLVAPPAFVIVLGGCLSSPESYAPLIAAMKEEFQTLSAHRTPQPIRFEPSALGEDATMVGAA